MVKCEKEVCVCHSADKPILHCVAMSRALSAENTAMPNPSVGFEAQNVGKSPRNLSVFSDSQGLA